MKFSENPRDFHCMGTIILQGTTQVHTQIHVVIAWIGGLLKCEIFFLRYLWPPSNINNDHPKQPFMMGISHIISWKSVMQLDHGNNIVMIVFYTYSLIHIVAWHLHVSNFLSIALDHHSRILKEI